MEPTKSGCDCGQCQLATLLWGWYDHCDVDKAFAEAGKIHEIMKHPTLAGLSELEFAHVLIETGTLTLQKYIAEHPDREMAVKRFDMELMIRGAQEKMKQMQH